MAQPSLWHNFYFGLPVDDVAGASFTENLTPGNDFEWVQRNLQRKIEVEKIQAVFDENGLGDARSKADKQLKAVIIKKIFGTTSNTEIEKISPTAFVVMTSVKDTKGGMIKKKPLKH